jgi:hypothetical protein
MTGILAATASGSAFSLAAGTRRPLKVMLLGFCFSGAYAWDLKASSDRWLDTKRFDLSALVVASRTLPIALCGRLGRVPESMFRGYGDLTWIAEDFRGVDVAVLIGDTRNKAFIHDFESVMRGVRRHVPMLIFVTVEQWTLTEPGLMPIRETEDETLLRAATRISDLSFARSERAAIERLRQAFRALDTLGRDILFNAAADEAVGNFSRVRFDCLASPVIELFGRKDCNYIRPSVLLS